MISLNSEQNPTQTWQSSEAATAASVATTAMSSYGKWEDTDDDLDFEGELPGPNSFCGRSFSVERDGKVITKPEWRGAAGVQFVLRSLL